MLTVSLRCARTMRRLTGLPAALPTKTKNKAKSKRVLHARAPLCKKTGTICIHYTSYVRRHPANAACNLLPRFEAQRGKFRIAYPRHPEARNKVGKHHTAPSRCKAQHKCFTNTLKVYGAAKGQETNVRTAYIKTYRANSRRSRRVTRSTRLLDSAQGGTPSGEAFS